MAKTSPFTFLRQVRQETEKVTWPSRKETVTMTIFVFIFVAIMSLFFLGTDWTISTVVEWLLTRGS